MADSHIIASGHVNSITKRVTENKEYCTSDACFFLVVRHTNQACQYGAQFWSHTFKAVKDSAQDFEEYDSYILFPFLSFGLLFRACVHRGKQKVQYMSELVLL